MEIYSNLIEIFMKTKISIFFLVFCLSLLSTFSNAQGVWEVQNPLPTCEPLNGSYWLNSTNLWAVGDNGTILKTVDGNTWTKLNSGTTSYLYGVYFFDANIGWAVGSNGTILKSTNGGSTWTSETSGTTQELYKVHFIDSNTGFIVGGTYASGSGIILKTTNGGNTWNILLSGYAYNFYDFDFIDTNNGWVVGDHGTILKTQNGGNAWTAQVSNTTNDLYTIQFINSNIGWAIGSSGRILKTIDGGITWNPQTSGVNAGLIACYFADTQTGWIAGEHYILKTIDGGQNWLVKSNSTYDYFNSICFADISTGWVIGNKILRTVDGGTSWINLITGVSNYALMSIYFSDANTGWSVGVGGTILKTINGGLSWLSQTSNTSNDLYGVQFVDNNNGWAVGASGTILRTNNRGLNWIVVTSGTSDYLFSVFFFNASNGWAVGGASSGTALFTIDGGQTWTVKANLPSKQLNYVHFFDASNGLALAPLSLTASTLLKTATGGNSWTSKTINLALNEVFFIDPNTAWAIGSNGSNIYKTTDGGTTWTTQVSSSGFMGLFFYDAAKGWVARTDGAVHGNLTMQKTTDGGSTWVIEKIPSLSVTKTYFVKPKVGWAAGFNGMIIHYTDYSPTTQASNVSIAGTTYQNINVSWTRGNGNQGALFAKQTNTGTCTPDVNVTYLPNATFGLGDQVGSTGWYCVYNGMGTSASISGLQANTAYTFQVCEYNFSPDFTHYNSTTATNNPITATTAIAPPQITTNPVAVTKCENLSTTFSTSASGTGLSYQWQVNSGPGFVNVTDDAVYSGSQTATLTLTGIPASLNSYKYHCVVSNTSGSATSNDAVLTVNPLPVTPSDISGSQIVCLNSIYPYSVSPIANASTYTWTYPAGFSVTSIIDNNINLTTSSGAVTGNITVQGLNGCGSGPVKSFPVSVRNLPANASQITGLNSVCTGSINIGYNTATISDADYYVWSLPLGATGTSSTNSIMVSYGTNPLTDQITVKGHNICGDGVQSVLPVSVNTVPEAIGTISGSSNLCKNQKDVLFSINAIPNATSYSWTLPQGIAGSNSMNSVSLNIGPDAFSGDVKVSGVNSCGTGAEIVFPVIVDAAPDSAGPITGPAKVCGGETNVQYSVPKSDKATSYIWSLPDGTSETTIANKIALNFDNNTISGNLTVSPVNSCGSGNSKSLFIDVTVPSKPEITSDNYKAGSCLGETPLKLSVKEALPGYNYLWYKNGASISSVASSYLEGYLSSGYYTVEADLDGCTSQSEIFKVLFSDAPEKPVIYSKGPTVWYLACSNENAPHYKWYYNGSIIPGEDKSVYVAAQNLGKYYVLVGNANGCYTASDEITIPSIIMGIDDIDLNSGIKIYPNPTTGKLTIEMNNKLFGDLMINILNQEGKVVSSKKIKKTTEELLDQTDLSALSKGIYYIHLIINDFNSSQKIIIE